MKLKMFLNNANFFPSILISKGKVIKPTIVNVVMNAEIAVIDAPFSKKDADRGNANTAGICIKAPSNPVKKTPMIPDLLLTILDIVSEDKNPKIIPIINTIINTIGIILRKDIIAIFTDCIAFFLSLIKANKNKISAIKLITSAVIFIFYQSPAIHP